MGRSLRQGLAQSASALGGGKYGVRFCTRHARLTEALINQTKFWQWLYPLKPPSECPLRRVRYLRGRRERH
jgi:hypothetical protein